MLGFYIMFKIIFTFSFAITIFTGVADPSIMGFYMLFEITFTFRFEFTILNAGLLYVV